MIRASSENQPTRLGRSPSSTDVSNIFITLQLHHQRAVRAFYAFFYSLFIHIVDLFDHSKECIKLFADDIKLYLEIVDNSDYNKLQDAIK